MPGLLLGDQQGLPGPRQQLGDLALGRTGRGPRHRRPGGGQQAPQPVELGLDATEFGADRGGCHPVRGVCQPFAEITQRRVDPDAVVLGLDGGKVHAVPPRQKVLRLCQS
ncbi:hypothetical protein CIK06_13580 [Plantactinospora sp. KBS50]|nr:hypothetical protein CIK06_13580 [Plantactinospora sp. KBS50]